MIKTLLLSLPPFVLADLSDAQAKANADGYMAESYTSITTEDGYVLSLFRITGKKQGNSTVIQLLSNLSDAMRGYSFSQQFLRSI
jgi:hypothetical protein